MNSSRVKFIGWTIQAFSNLIGDRTFVTAKLTVDFMSVEKSRTE